MLAEVRKFRQGIMILDQRPSSLVGGVLDNALINIMCRLNDRSGFEHLSHVLNLDPAQQRYARTRLRAGQTLVLDASSGLPVLLRAPLVVDVLRSKNIPLSEELKQTAENARKANLLCPEFITPSQAPGRNTQATILASIWGELSKVLEDKVAAEVLQAINTQDWTTTRNRIRGWLLQHRRELNPLLENTIFIKIIENIHPADMEELLREFSLQVQQ